jgi:hypothetical protein
MLVTINFIVKLIVVYNVFTCKGKCCLGFTLDSMIANATSRSAFSCFNPDSGRLRCRSASVRQLTVSDVVDSKDGLQLCLVLLKSRVVSSKGIPKQAGVVAALKALQASRHFHALHQRLSSKVKGFPSRRGSTLCRNDPEIRFHFLFTPVRIFWFALLACCSLLSMRRRTAIR